MKRTNQESASSSPSTITVQFKLPLVNNDSAWREHFLVLLLPFIKFLSPANDVWAKLIFSQASVCPGGVGLPDRDPPGEPPPFLYGKERAARIQLECILITIVIYG